MASIRKRNGSWVADIRRKGHKSLSKSFPTKSLATEWARKIESEIDAQQFKDGRSLNSITFGDLIDRYILELGTAKPFGKNKAAVLVTLKTALGACPLPELTVERLNKYCDERMAGGAGGVTLAIDLTYIGQVLKTAASIWKMPVDRTILTDARAHLSYKGVSTRGMERKRRPTAAELDKLCAHFKAKARQKVPMPDLIRFAVATAMRLGEIIRIRWDDLNEQDRTITIRDRKHPREKQGNDQEVPLLGEAFDIVKRQPRTDDARIFPVTEGTVSTIFPRACKELGIEGLRFHDFRHEGVSRLFEQSYTIEQVALVSGHRDWKMLARYTQIKAKDLHRPAPKLNLKAQA